MNLRSISQRWQPEKLARSTIHEAAAVLPPGHWQQFDPFLMLAEDWFQHGTFEEHPHRGIETVTYVISGQMRHYDNKSGHTGVLGPEDVQWMTAGHGVIHQEDPLPGEPVHSLQLWINLPREKKLMPPRYQDLSHDKMPCYHHDGVLIRVYSGTVHGMSAPTQNIVPITMAEVRMEPHSTVDLDLAPEHNGFLYILEGHGIFGANAEPGSQGEVLWLGPAPLQKERSWLTVRSSASLRAILYAGTPIGEPVFAYGPFVMNTREDIEEAFRDYHAGRFI